MSSCWIVFAIRIPIHFVGVTESTKNLLNRVLFLTLNTYYLYQVNLLMITEISRLTIDYIGFFRSYDITFPISIVSGLFSIVILHTFLFLDQYPNIEFLCHLKNFYPWGLLGNVYPREKLQKHNRFYLASSSVLDINIHESGSM